MTGDDNFAMRRSLTLLPLYLAPPTTNFSLAAHRTMMLLTRVIAVLASFKSYYHITFLRKNASILFLILCRRIPAVSSRLRWHSRRLAARNA